MGDYTTRTQFGLYKIPLILFFFFLNFPLRSLDASSVDMIIELGVASQGVHCGKNAGWWFTVGTLPETNIITLQEISNRTHWTDP